MRRLAVWACGAAVVLVACGGSDASTSTPVVESGTVTVDALDNTFRRKEITVAPGTEVVWTNKGRNDHDILPVDGGKWGAEPDAFGPDATYTNRFTNPGTYEYYCSLHGTKAKGMIGTVTVRE
jgi:plastocyanin